MQKDMKKYISRFKILIIIFACFFYMGIPLINSYVLASSSESLVPCGTEKDPSTGKITNPCDFDGFMTMINNVINFILIKLALPISAIMFAYSGFLFLISGGNAEKKSQAVGIFTNVAVGLIIIAASWLIIHTILVLLGYNGEKFGF